MKKIDYDLRAASCLKFKWKPTYTLQADRHLNVSFAFAWGYLLCHVGVYTS